MANISTLKDLESTEIGGKVSPVDAASPIEKIPQYQSNADGALQMLEAGNFSSNDPEKSKRLLRRIDLYIMPLICM